MPCALVTPSDCMSTKDRSIVGIRSAMVNPSATSRSLTWSITGPRLRVTVSPCALIAPPGVPSSRVTTCSCATRLTRSHTTANCGLATIRSTCVRVKLSMPLLMGTASAGSAVASRGGRSPLRERLEHLRGERLDVDVLEDRAGHVLRDRALHGGVLGQRGDGLDVLLGVRHLSARPDRCHRQGASRQARVMSTAEETDHHTERLCSVSTAAAGSPVVDSWASSSATRARSRSTSFASFISPHSLGWSTGRGVPTVPRRGDADITPVG